MSTVKTFKAMQEVPGLSQSEIDEFLRSSKSILHLGTIDQKGEPLIHPVWYHYASNRLYIITDKNSQKAKNMSRKSKVYFSVDTEASPYKGVKGKGTTSTVKDTGKALAIAEKIVAKYMGGLDNPIGKGLMKEVRSGSEVVIEIAPNYYSVWDYGKARHS